MAKAEYFTGKGFKALQEAEVLHPAFSDCLGYQSRQTPVALDKPSSRGYTVCDITEFTGKNSIKVVEYIIFQYFRVKLRHAVHTMAANDGKAGHIYPSLAVAGNYGHSNRSLRVVPESLFDLYEKPPVYLPYDLEMTREQVSHQSFGPCLQCLGQDCMVCIR